MTTTTRRLLSFSTTALLVLALAHPAAAAPTGPWSSRGGDLLARAWAHLAELTSGLFGGSLERIAAEEGLILDPDGAPNNGSSSGGELGLGLDPDGNSGEGDKGHGVDPDG